MVNSNKINSLKSKTNGFSGSHSNIVFAVGLGIILATLMKSLRSGEMLFRQDDAGDGMYFVVSGRVNHYGFVQGGIGIIYFSVSAAFGHPVSALIKCCFNTLNLDAR